MNFIRRLTCGIAIAALFTGPAQAADDAAKDEGAASALFDRIVTQPARLRVFLQAMPKGGDLHNHLWGQPHAEQFIAWGADAGLCASREKLAIVPPPCDKPGLTPLKDLGRRDERLYSRMIDSLSSRGRDQGLGVNDTTGHDDFFDTFGRFVPVALSAVGPMLASARTSAAANRVSYLELMENPEASDKAGKLALASPWQTGDFEAAFRHLSPALPALVAEAMAETDRVEAQAVRELKCDVAKPAPAPCAVTVRYQSYGLRSQEPAYVFGQLALGFALADKDPRYVAVNIVAPEDGAVSVADFDQHMAMFAFLSTKYPAVKKAIHAGELDLGLVPPAALRHHIRDSVEVAGANRIGHGVDIAYETDAPALLARMAKDRIAVEINLTSNDTILGVKGARHPLALYRAAGVPVVLSTDDEGVSRSDMTNEYLRAATEQGLRYADLKAMARASLEYAFLPGASFWKNGRMGERNDACRDEISAQCRTLLSGSAKADAQWRLEQDFTAFEKSIIAAKF